LALPRRSTWRAAYIVVELPVTYTYRDPDVFKGRALGLTAFSICALVLVSLVGAFVAGWVPLAFGAFGVFIVVHQYGVYRQLQYGSCGEIRLDDDGTCELETRGSVIRLHVNEISSVRYSGENDEQPEYYTIHFRSTRLHVAKRMTDFPDFLARLKTLHPAVDLTSFPAETWPGVGAAPEERGTPLRRLLTRSLLLPLSVVVLLVYLATRVT
jgi:hypothetical protein